MSESTAEGRSSDRPVLFTESSRTEMIPPSGGGSSKIRTPSRSRQYERLGGKFEALLKAFEDGTITIDAAMSGGDPELVIVLETSDSQSDVAKAAENAGLELLIEVEEELDPDDDFPRIKKDGSLSGNLAPVPSCLHAVCASKAAATTLVSAWREWIASGKVAYGQAPIRNLFERLRDVRPWGPQDRIRLGNVVEQLDGMLPEQIISVEIELWFRLSQTLRAQAEARVVSLILAGGGDFHGSAIVETIGYHGISASIPLEEFRRLVVGDYEDFALVRSTDVLYLRAAGQTVDETQDDESELVADVTSSSASTSGTGGEAIVALIDGLPIANHQKLQDRIVVLDTDDLGSMPDYEAKSRRHGTAMASVLVWGDLNGENEAATHPIVVRPILRLSPTISGFREELPDDELIPDLMRRVFRELLGDPLTGEGAQAPEVVVVNLSLGDPAMPFDRVPSAWAKILDWLTYEYGVLAIVSAGNHHALSAQMPSSELLNLKGDDRRKAIRQAVAGDAMNRRLLSPAESMNSLTIGAIHRDEMGDFDLGSRFDPWDGIEGVSTVTPLGYGIRRSIKPELLETGGRLLLKEHGGDPAATHFVPSSHGLGPGVKVASWVEASPGNGVRFEHGTSISAALVSRRAAELYDLVVEQSERQLSKRDIAVALKALLVHEAQWPPSISCDPIEAGRYFGYGSRSGDLKGGCLTNEVTLLYSGWIHAGERQYLDLPLPDGLQGQGLKRVTATLAWLTPINWRHRQYRKAKLKFDKPKGLVTPNLLGVTEVSGLASQRGTLQQQIYETEKASASVLGSDLSVTVSCAEQAGGLNGAEVAYACAVSLWLAPELNVDVYQQVADQVRGRVSVTPVRL